MNIGSMRHRLALQTETQAQGATGEVTSTYATDTTVWGSIWPLKAEEMETARQISEKITHRAVIRYYGSLTTEYRISHDSRTFEVAGIRNWQERDIFQELYLTEVL